MKVGPAVTVLCVCCSHAGQDSREPGAVSPETPGAQETQQRAPTRGVSLCGACLFLGRMSYGQPCRHSVKACLTTLRAAVSAAPGLQVHSTVLRSTMLTELGSSAKS